MNRAIWDDLIGKALLYSPRLMVSLLLLIVFWVAGAIAAKVIRGLGGMARLNEDVRNLIASIARISVLVIGVITALGTLGIDVTALVAGLGLTGFALSFAFKDIISNALAGILILVYEPFRRNDRISVTALEGIVAQIDMRYTTLQTTDQQILIPNSNLFTNPIIVYHISPGTPNLVSETPTLHPPEPQTS